jgi:hypothetical protein
MTGKTEIESKIRETSAGPTHQSIQSMPQPLPRTVGVHCQTGLLAKNTA